MKKKTVSLLLVFVMVISMAFPAFVMADTRDIASGETGSVPWRITGSNELIIGKAGQEYTFNNEHTYGGSSAYGWLDYKDSIKKCTFAGKVNGNADMSVMFAHCSAMTEINGLNNFNTENVQNMQYMFWDCKSLTELDLSGFNTKNVTNMYGMFEACRSLKKLNVSSFDTRLVRDFGDMFRGCESLEKLDVSHFNTRFAVKMESMFNGCSSLTFLDVKNFNTEKVDRMHYMFSQCSSLEELDLRNFDTSNVLYMESMFEACTNLKSVDVSSFNTEKVKKMGAMFERCSSLPELDLSNFNTDSCTEMNVMFRDCSSLQKLDLRGFNTENLQQKNGMFENCSSLNTLALGTKSVFTENPPKRNWNLYMTLDGKAASGNTYAALSDYNGSKPGWYKSADPSESGSHTPSQGGSQTPSDGMILGGFPDVTHDTVNNTSYNAIYWAVDNNIVKGYSDGNFKPEVVCTREQFSIMLWRFAGQPASDTNAANKFTDVSSFSGTTSKKAVAWAVEKGIVKGFSDGSFGPGQDITRAQVSVMLWRFANEPAVSGSSKFSDIGKFSSSVQNAIIWLEGAGVASGYKDGTFKPDEGCQRQHMAIFLNRFNSKVKAYK